jgi:hypothetical protein
MDEGPSAREIFADELLRHEEIVWQGKPEASALFTRGDVFLVPFGITWGGFALAWEALVLVALLSGEDKAANGGSLWFMAVFGLIFVAVGLYMLVGRFLVKRWSKAKTHYALTNMRALAFSNFVGQNIRSVPIKELGSLRKSSRSDGIGTIWFGHGPPWVTLYGNTGLDFLGHWYGEAPLAFYDVRDVDAICRLVSEVRSK